MDLSKKIRIGTVVGVLALGVIVPATVAMAQADDDSAGAAARDAGEPICFEVDGMLPGLGFGEAHPFEGGLPFGDLGDLPLDLGGLGLEGLDLSELPAPDEIMEQLNAAAEELASYLNALGIEYELETGPLGMTWVLWDFSDPAANQAVEEFYREHGGPIDIVIEELPFDLEGVLEGLPFDLQEMDLEGMLGDLEGVLEELPFDLQEMDLEGMLGDLEGILDVDGLLEGLDLGEFPLGEGFVFEMPPEGGMPFGLEGLPLDGEVIWGGGLVCIEPIEARAAGLIDEAAELAKVLEGAGIEVTFETVEVQVPVWDEEAEGVQEILEEFYADRHGVFPSFDIEMGVTPFDDDESGGGDDRDLDGGRSGALNGLPWNLAELTTGTDGGSDS